MGIMDLFLWPTDTIIKKIRKIDEAPVTGGLPVGIFRSNAKGFGFVTIEGEEEDYYISKENTAHAFDGDTVIIERIFGQSGRSKEARITAIVTHAVTRVVGTFQKNRTSAFVIPDNGRYNQDIFIPKERRNRTVDGQKVVCQIVRYAKGRYSAEGEIIEILGHRDDPGVDILSIVKDAGVPYEFPAEVLNEAIAVSAPVSRKEMAHREDWREKRIVTIDGDDTKDFDDAVSIERDGDEYILGVHIADVSHYVKEGSLLDKEAQKRATSIYLADRVIPMLPHTLSNGICSLNEGEDRLTLSCIMRFSAKGKLIDRRIAPSVIRVTHRMTYNDVNAILERKEDGLRRKYRDMIEDFETMEELSQKLRRRRQKRGAVDFDFTESKILLDEDGHPTEILPYVRGISQMMIEDFMIAANETVAAVFCEKEIPFLYRTHEKPSRDKIIDLKRFIAKFGLGLHLTGDSVEPKELQKLIKKVQGTSEENLISTLVLHSMQRAEYRTEEIGHYGLAAEYYSHFTSPIRRYPDLMIHRIIKEALEGKMKRKRKSYYTTLLPEIAKNCTAAEKRADDLERDVEKLKKVEYMSDHIGEEFEGLISGVTGWGFYVSLPNTVEGLVPMTSLDDDYYTFSEETYELVGRHFNKRYRLGTPVKVRVAACDEKRRTLDFVVAGRKGEQQERRIRRLPSKKGKGNSQKWYPSKAQKGNPSKAQKRNPSKAGRPLRQRKEYGKRKRAVDRQQ